MKGKAMIGAKEIMYFIHPVPSVPAKLENWDGAKAFALSWYNASRTRHQPGEIVDVRSRQVEGRQYYLVNDEGYYLHGHLMNRAIGSEDYRIAFVTPELFALVSRYDRSYDHNTVYAVAARWSDGQLRPTGSGGWPLTVPAAPWAADLFPAENDTPFVVAAKVAQAKQRWEEMSAKLEILREGLRRNWLQHLAEIRAAGHAFPYPTFHLSVSGQAMLRVPAMTKAAQAKAQAKLESAGGKLKDQTVQGHPVYVAIPINELLELDLTPEEIGNMPPSTIRDHVQSVLGNYDIQYMPQSQQTILAGIR